MTAVFKIKGEVEKKYRGCGLALAAIKNGAVLDIAYLREILPEVDFNEPGFDIEPYLEDPRVGIVMFDFEAKGRAVIGMLSCYEFVIL